MALLARIIGLSLLTGAVAAQLALVFFGQESLFAAFILACVGGIVGALAGAAREIVAALHRDHLG